MTHPISFLQIRRVLSIKFRGFVVLPEVFFGRPPLLEKAYVWLSPVFCNYRPWVYFFWIMYMTIRFKYALFG